MADDDLLLTNKYADLTSDEHSDKTIFSKLIDAKKQSEEVYNDQSPTFTTDSQVNETSGLSVNENSVAFEQFINFAQTDKKKKISKTILNIDSKNRNKLYTYDSKSVEYSGNTPLKFTRYHSTFTIDINSIRTKALLSNASHP